MVSGVVIAACALLAAGGAALFRLRGSEAFEQWTGRGATTSRLLWAAYLALAAWLMDGAWSAQALAAVGLAAALWLGSIAGWWKSLDMGTHEGTFAHDLALHSFRGVLWTGPAAMVVVLSGMGTPWPLLVVGALCGPIYAVCRVTERAEWVFGGGIAAALLGGVAFA